MICSRKGANNSPVKTGNLFCVDGYGKVICRTPNLGIDGVIIERFTEEKLYGSGEWDPPGGWRDFVLDLKTGKKE